MRGNSSADPAYHALYPARSRLLCPKLGEMVPLAHHKPLVWRIYKKLARGQGYSDEDKDSDDCVFKPDYRVFSRCRGSVFHWQGYSDNYCYMRQHARTRPPDTGPKCGVAVESQYIED